MPYTTVAWDESQDSATLAAVAAVADQHIRVSGDNILVPRGLNRLAGVLALGANLTRARLVAPSLAKLANFEITPLNVAAEPSSPTPFLDLFDRPFEFVETEFLSAEAAEDAAGAARSIIVAFFSDGPVTPYTGDFVTIRATSTQTLVADAWTNCALTFASTLPGGRFACVGARVEAAGAIAARFVPVGSGGTYRPGVIAYDAAGDLENQRFRAGNAGVLFEFDNDTPPTVDVLSVSADTAETVWLDVVQIG